MSPCPPANPNLIKLPGETFCSAGAAPLAPPGAKSLHVNPRQPNVAFRPDGLMFGGSRGTTSVILWHTNRQPFAGRQYTDGLLSDGLR